MANTVALSEKAARHVAELTGTDTPSACQVAKVWNPFRSRCPPRLAAEIEVWIAQHHAGFRLQQQLSNRAQHVLINVIGHHDYGPHDLGRFDEGQMRRWENCGGGTFDEILRWMRSSGVSPAMPETMPDNLVSTLDALASTPDGADRLRDLLGVAWASMGPRAQKSFLEHSDVVAAMDEIPSGSMKL